MNNPLAFIRHILSKLFLVLAVLLPIAVLVSISISAFNSDALSITATNTNISAKLSYYVDETNAVTLDNISEKNFTPSAFTKVPYHLDQSTYWLLVTLSNHTTTPLALVLHADNPLLDTFEIYQSHHSLHRLLKSKSDFNNLTEQVFPHYSFTLKANKTKQLLIKTRTLGPPNIPIVLYSAENFASKMQMTQLLFGGFIGILLMVAIYNVIMYFAIKDNIYLLYIGYLVSAFLVVSVISGFDANLFSAQISDFLSEHLIFLQYCLEIALILFTLYFLHYHQDNDRYFKVGLLSTAALALLALYSLTLNSINQAQIFFYLQPLIYLFAIVVISKKLKREFYWARLYFISWIPFLIGSAVQPLLLMGKLDYAFLTRHAFLIAVLFEISFMAFALAERIRRNEHEKLKSMFYHPDTNIAKSVVLKNKMKVLIKEYQAQFSVLVIKPEHIDRVSLYFNTQKHNELFKKMYLGLNGLFSYNNAIIAFNAKNEKVAQVDNCLVLLVDTKKMTQSFDVLIQSIQDVISQHYQVGSVEIPLTALIGLANYPEHGKSSQLLLNRAKLALNNAKLHHKKWSSVQLADAEQDEYMLKLASAFKEALHTNKLEIYHQPQIDLKTLSVCGSECLLRWQHPTKGHIHPKLIVSIAEDMGIISDLTLWTIKKSLEQHQAVIENKFANHTLAININSVEICNTQFYDKVVSLIDGSMVSSDKLIFEFSESATLYSSPQALETLNKLSQYGITISIDDFGLGYSSIQAIISHPFKELKIEHQFVENVAQSKEINMIAKTTTQMAKSLGLEVVAQGITTTENEKLMREFGCDIGQGYYYAKPMNIMSYILWLKNQSKGRTPTVEGDFIPKAQTMKYRFIDIEKEQ